MHVLILPSWYPNKNNPLSGIFFKEQAEALAKQKLNIGCIAINETSPRYMFSNKAVSFHFYDNEVNYVNTIGVLYPIPNRFKVLRKLIRKIVFKIVFKKYIKKYGKPSLIHLHSFLYGDLAIWIKRKYNIDYIVTEHSSGFAKGIYSKKELSYAKNVFYNSKYNICVSHEFKMLLENRFNIEFRYIPNAINTSFFVPNVKKREKFNFINIAFLNKNKNQLTLIKAFTKAFRDNEDIRLTIVGDGRLYESLSNLIKTFNMQKQIKLYGVANRHEILELLQNSDAFVLSSEYETFGIVILEAMSCGLPVVSTRCGGPESVLINDKLGKLVNKNIDSLSNGMQEVYNTTYDKNYIREYVIHNFSSDTISKKLIEIYKK